MFIVKIRPGLSSQEFLLLLLISERDSVDKIILVSMRKGHSLESSRFLYCA